MEPTLNEKNSPFSGALLNLFARSEHKYLRSGGSECFLVFHVHACSAPTRTNTERLPLKLALVLDRSGSMQGEKLSLAKRATQAVVDQLTERDSVAVVVFDNAIDLIQPAARVTAKLKSQIREALHTIEARASTALHEGWLTGCNAIVSEASAAQEGEFGRCFLLTDGIANVGVTDPEQIASEAAGVREHTHISTSTFGIGQDYNELLLGPMAVAGGGQFHHLRNPEEIFSTFVGELGELFKIAARQVRLEVELESGLTMDLISTYWQDAARGSITIGDLQYDEEQHIVIRVHFPAKWSSEKRTVRARLVWLEGNEQKQTAWQELHFSYTDEATYEQETPDPEVLHWAGLHNSDRARREAVERNNRGDLAGAQAVLQSAVQWAVNTPGAPPSLQSEANSLNELRQQIAAAPLAPAKAKEVYYQQQRRSRNKQDYRQSKADDQGR